MQCLFREPAYQPLNRIFLAFCGWGRLFISMMISALHLKKKEVVFVFAIFSILTLPFLFFHLFPDKEALFSKTHPRLISGDETHYFAILQSLLADGDFDLYNNYRSIPPGFEGRLDYRKHHTWVVDKQTNEISYFNDANPQENVREYSRHGVGYPVLAYPLGKLFSLSPDWALRLLTWLATFSLLLLFYRRLKIRNAPQAGLKTILFLVMTPFWQYSGGMFTEPLLAALFLLTVVLVEEDRSLVLCSAVVFLGCLVKMSFVSVFVPVFYYYLRRNSSNWLKLLLPVLAGGLIHVVWNHAWFHRVLFYQQKIPGEVIFDTPSGILHRLFVYLIDPEHGVLLFVPIVLTLVMPRFGKGLKENGVWLWVVCWVGLVSVTASAHDGTAYGPRQLLPIIPLLVFPILEKMDFQYFNKRYLILYCLVGLSILVNCQAAFFNSHCYAAPPWVFLKRIWCN